jgi:hypothetical protein
LLPRREDEGLTAVAAGQRAILVHPFWFLPTPRVSGDAGPGRLGCAAVVGEPLGRLVARPGIGPELIAGRIRSASRGFIVGAC